MDQKRHKHVVAKTLNSSPVRLAFEGKPTFRQNIDLGLPAGSTAMLLAIVDS